MPVLKNVVDTEAVYNPTYVPATYKDVTRYEGATLYIGTRYTAVMSDVWENETYAVVWDKDEDRIKDICWIKGGEVDATPEVVAYARAEKVGSKFQDLKYNAEAAARRIVVGDDVEVIKGKTAKGTVGKVAVIIKKVYPAGYNSTTEDKLCIATSDVKVKVAAANGRVYDNYRDVVWVWARNVNKLNKVEIDEDELWALAEDAIPAQPLFTGLRN